MRTIKFRAWDKKLKKMVVFDEFEFENTGGFWGGDREVWQMSAIHEEGECDGAGYFHDDFAKETKLTPMQFTGLKDKNGKEIYEGDILEDSFKMKAKAIWFENTHMAMTGFTFKSDIKIGYEVFEMGWLTTAKIIGNIYENPELLKGGDK